MSNLRNVEIKLAYAMPLTAVVPLVWYLDFLLEHLSSTGTRKLEAGLLLLLITVVAPAFVYWILGIVSYFAAKRNSTTLTILLWVILVPVLYVNGFLLILVHYEGLYALLFFLPTPLVAIVAALISLASRIAGYANQQSSYD